MVVTSGGYWQLLRDADTFLVYFTIYWLSKFQQQHNPQKIGEIWEKSVALDKPPDFFVHSQAAESESKQFGWYDAKGTAYGPPQSTEREIVRAICVNKLSSCIASYLAGNPTVNIFSRPPPGYGNLRMGWYKPSSFFALSSSPRSESCPRVQIDCLMCTCCRCLALKE